jgi:hypothetical protein
MTTENAKTLTEEIAKKLQARRETYVKVLEALPCPKAKLGEFPYANMDQAIRDDFKLFDGGKDDAFALLVKGFKTRGWRKAAETNRASRDAMAEGEVSVPTAKRVVKKLEAIKAEAKTEAAA